MEATIITNYPRLEKYNPTVLKNFKTFEEKEKKEILKNSLYTKVIQVITEINSVLIGKRKAIESALISLFTNGHLLVEDVPGVGKTMLAKALAKTLGLSFTRIQFTPDLLPSDITGISIYNQKRQEFEFKVGPVFTDILLADEINRATPRTQSSLLESMGESQVTVDGRTYKLSDYFFVIATQNPLEQHGTYPLPESQLDRFMLKINMGYPAIQQEIEILEAQLKGEPIDRLNPLLTREDISKIREEVKKVFVDRSILKYIANIIDSTRKHKDILKGVSTRGSIALLKAAQGMAFISNLDYVEPNMIKKLAKPVLSHRIILNPQASISGLKSEDVIEEVLENVKVPTI